MQRRLPEGIPMIMRRLAQRLKEQDWTAIAIEFVLLVLGVFLGIQVANWNEARQEHAREAGFLARLLRDFESIDARLTQNAERWQSNLDSANRLLSDLDELRAAGRWPRDRLAMLEDLNVITSTRTPAPRAGTYIEMQSDGRLGILQDLGLRDALRSYDGRAASVALFYTIMTERIEPFRSILVAHLRFDRTLTADKVVDIAQRHLKHGEYFVDVDLQTLGAEPALQQALNLHASNFLDLLVVTRVQQRDAQAVLAMLRNEPTNQAETPP